MRTTGRIVSDGALALATAMLLWAAGPANAIPIVGSFTGTVDVGTDLSGVFGLPAGDLSGQALTGTFSYDPEAAPSPLGEGLYLSSGALNWLSASIAINGASYSFDAYAADPATHHELMVGVTDDPNLDSFSLNLTRTTVLADLLLEQQLTLSVLGLTDFISGLELPQSLSWTSASPAWSAGGTFVVGCYTEGCTNPAFTGSFSLSTLSVTPVPEPATLGLFAAGLLGIWRASGRRGRKPALENASLSI